MFSNSIGTVYKRTAVSGIRKYDTTPYISNLPLLVSVASAELRAVLGIDSAVKTYVAIILGNFCEKYDKITLTGEYTGDFYVSSVDYTVTRGIRITKITLNQDE